MRSSSIRIPARPTIEEIENAISQVPYVFGKRDCECAWLLIYEWPEEDGDANKYVCDVQSRGDDSFAAVICYAIGKAFGEKIEDDAGFLEAGRDFTVNEFGEMLKRRL
jgi:hypothetical protein